MAVDEEKRRCPNCKGIIISNRKTLLQNINVYWQKPWGGTLKMDEPVMPYACVVCGQVTLILKNRKKVVREWNELSDDEKKMAKAE